MNYILEPSLYHGVELNEGTLSITRKAAEEFTKKQEEKKRKELNRRIWREGRLIKIGPLTPFLYDKDDLKW